MRELTSCRWARGQEGHALLSVGTRRPRSADSGYFFSSTNVVNLTLPSSEITT